MKEHKKRRALVQNVVDRQTAAAQQKWQRRATRAAEDEKERARRRDEFAKSTKARGLLS